MQVYKDVLSGNDKNINLNDSVSALGMAINLPSQYIKMLAGETDTAVSKDELGFIIRRSDIHSIRAYVRESRTLPVDYNRIVEWFSSAMTSVPGLEPASIQSFHQRVVQHAATWGALERDTKELSRQLNRFSDSFITTASGIIELINKVEFERFLTGSLEELTEEEEARLQGIVLSSSELKAVSIVREYVLLIKRDTESYIKRTNAVGALAAEFERVLSEVLIPEVNAKLAAFAKAGLSAEREALLVHIKELDDEIEQLIKDYRSQVLYGHSGIILGPIGLAITGGIFGVKAEAVRARKNSLITKRDIARQSSKDQQRLVVALDATQQRFVDLHSRMLGAEQGAKQLAQVWAYIVNYLDEAAIELEGLDTLARLHKFKLDFSQLLNPWRRVKDYSFHISRAFNEIINERI